MSASPPMLTITRRFQFCAGHRLYRPEWSDEQNQAVFGPCANANGHGHNYTLDVELSGPIDPETGMIVNLRQIKQVVTDRVLADVDHKNLNADVPWLVGVIPTTEQFAVHLWQRLEANLALMAPHAKLSGLELRETPNNKVTLRRGETTAP